MSRHNLFGDICYPTPYPPHDTQCRSLTQRCGSQIVDDLPYSMHCDSDPLFFLFRTLFLFPQQGLEEGGGPITKKNGSTDIDVWWGMKQNSHRFYLCKCKSGRPLVLVLPLVRPKPTSCFPKRLSTRKRSAL